MTRFKRKLKKGESFSEKLSPVLGCRRPKSWLISSQHLFLLLLLLGLSLTFKLLLADQSTLSVNGDKFWPSSRKRNNFEHLEVSNSGLSKRQLYTSLKETTTTRETWNSTSEMGNQQMPIPSSSAHKKTAAEHERPKRHAPATSTEARRKAGAQTSTVATAQEPVRPKVIHSMLRGHALFPCDLRSPEPDDSVILVLWFKDSPNSAPIYSVDARSASIEEARLKPGEPLAGRSSLKILPLRSLSRNRRAESIALSALSEDKKETSQLIATPNLDILHSSQLNSWSRRRRRRRVRQHQELGFVDESLARFAAMEAFGLPVNSKASSSDTLAPNEALSQLMMSDGRVLDTLDKLGQQQQLVAQLRIGDLASEDNGSYFCQVAYRKARTREQEFLLKIIVPADKPTIRDLSGSSNGQVGLVGDSLAAQRATGGSLVGPHNEGAKIVLECSTQGGYPEPILSWWRDGRLVDDSYEIVSTSDGLVLGQREAGSSGLQIGEETTTDSAAIANAAHLLDRARDGSLSSSDESLEQMMTPATEGLATISQQTVASVGGTSKQMGNNQNRLIRNRLELNGLSRNDLLANYSCQAWNTKLAEPPTSFAMIDMNLRPIKVQIDGDRQAVQADKPLELVCRAFGSRPAASISWWRAGNRLMPYETIRDEQRNRLRNELANQLVGLEDRKGGSKQVISVVGVQIQESISADGNVTTSTLSLIPQVEDGGQIITCRAENHAMANLPETVSQQFSIEDSLKLDVHYLPRVTLALGEKLQRNIQEGHDVYLDCSVRAHPVAHEVRWWFEGRELETNITSGIIVSNQSLVLQRVNRNQRGRYTCSAINSVGESQSNSVHLRVQYAPFCRDAPTKWSSDKNVIDRYSNNSNNNNSDLFNAISQQRYKTHYGAARMEPVQVRCHVDADPADSISYKWAFVATSGRPILPPTNSKPEFSGQQLVFLEANASRVEEGQLISLATYTPISESDYGTLLCWAQNSIGQQAEPCVYQIVPAERPDPVRNCRLINASDTQLTVACQPGYDGGVDQSFHMEVYDSDHHELVANISATQMLADNKYPISQLDKTGSENTTSYQDDSTGDLSSGQQALLVSEPVVSRQQKQRHSHQSQRQFPLFSTTNNNNHRQQSADQIESSSLSSALLITDSNLKPATDYFLSIYSSNSKGSSKPVAFTATTMNASEPLDLAHDARRTDPSHLLGDVLALSWNPFLVVCVVSVALFIMFASITFAMMKYVDFSGNIASSLSNGRRHSDNDTYEHCNLSSSLNGSGASSSLRQKRGCKEARLNSSSNNNDDTTSNNLCELYSSSSATTTNCTSTKGPQRARVITLANSSTLSSDGDNCHIPLNGIPRKERLLTGGSYLRLKLQQFTGGPLRHSSSDNHLNGTTATNSTGIQQQQQQQQQQQHPPTIRGGTLPRNLSALHSVASRGQVVESSPLDGQDQDGTNNLCAPGHFWNQRQQPMLQQKLGEARVEQLIISGKQYIHQTPAANNNNRNSYRIQQKQQQARHLQMTSALEALQRNVYSQTVCRDYNKQTTFPVNSTNKQQQQLVCIDQTTGQLAQLEAAMCQLATCKQSGFNLSNQEAQTVLGGTASQSGSEAFPGQQQTLGLMTNESFQAAGEIAALATTDVGQHHHQLQHHQHHHQQQQHFHEMTNPGDKCPECNTELPINIDTNTNATYGLYHRTSAQLSAMVNGNNVACGINLDSDGLSSGTQRSFTTSNGSPSSGVCMEGVNQENGRQPLPCMGINCQQTGSNSTITSQHDIFDCGGNVISVLHHSNNSNSAINNINCDSACSTDLLTRATGKVNKPAICTSNSIKQAKKSKTPKFNQNQVEQQQQQQNFDALLNSYAMYVDGNNNNLGDFYVLPVAQENPIGSSNKSRVCFLADGTISNSGTAIVSQQDGSSSTTKTEEVLGSLPQNFDYASSGTSSCGYQGGDLHTDV